jgi:uncharacterized membrane protein
MDQSSGVPPDVKPSRTLHVMVRLLFGLAILLRVALVERHVLWADEFFSLAMATGHSLEHPAAAAVPALGDFVEERDAVPAASYSRYLEHEDPPASLTRVGRAVLLSDTNPPLYYLLLHGWTRALGATDRALGLFSVLWALAAFPLIYSLGWRLGGRRAALSAGLLYSVAPVSLFYSVEGRMYSMVWFLAAATGWISLRLHDRGQRPVTLVILVLVSAAGLLTHYFYLFAWAACLTWLAIYPGRLTRQSLLVMALLTCVLVLPWYLQLPESLNRWRVAGEWLEGSLSIRQTLSAPFLTACRLVSGCAPWDDANRLNRLAALVLVLALGTFYWTRAMFTPDRLLLWLWLIAACTGPLVFDLLRGTVTSLIPRYALAGMPAAILLMSVALARLGRAGNALVVLLLGLWAPGLRDVLGSKFRARRPYRAAAERVAAWAGPADLVIVHSIPSGVVAIARYLPPATPVAAWIGQLGQRRVPEDLIALTRNRNRVALIKIHTVGNPAREADWLRAHADSVEEFTYTNARIFYFTGVANSPRPSSAEAEATLR